MTSFIPNGLLGSSLSTLGVDDQTVTAGSEHFIPNGLLGDQLCAETQPSTFHKVNRLQDTQLGTASLNMFIPNGLLSNTINTLSETQEGPSTSQRDDYLPSVHEVFDIPAGPNSNPSISPPNRSTYSISATTFNGKTFHIRKKRKATSRLNRSTISADQRMAKLLDVPIHRMLDELAAETASNIQNGVQVSPQLGPVDDMLWVDKYRPQKFVELMGNERVARETMAWVKRWDWCVFGSRKGRKRPRAGDENYDESDEYRRPREKLLLLSGPPGLGKTTMAHVIARQAGYEVMEINASDARSASIVEDRIRPALESGSAVGSAKPVLLIIDEIDGATGAGDNSNTFIHKLVALTVDRSKKKRQKGANSKRPLLRPIICICNDHNASSLAKLRPHALQIRFQRPADVHTVKRLREVCEIEGLKAESRALATLVAVAKGDLRGCLNTLQFIKSRKEEVTESIVRKATLGMKEADTSLNAALNSLFTPLSKKRVRELAMTEEEEARYVGRLSQDIDASGRESNLAIGCFGHYATLRQHDANFSRYEKANEWLITFDGLSASMYSNGDFALSPYLPYTLIPFYPLFQERGGERIERNQADWENLQVTKSNEEILKSLSRCLRNASTRLGGDFRHLLSSPTLQLEFAPFINRIISPPLRPVNSQIIKAEERLLLSRLVNIMASLDLRFLQERAEDGQLSYRLDPAIDVFVTYDGKRAGDIPTSRYAVRHLVAGEIDALLTARDVDIIEKGRHGKHTFGTSSYNKTGVVEESLDPDFPNKRPRKDKVDIADRPPTDFFGRVISVPSASTDAPTRQKPAKQFRVSYRFTEGNSAAVRKPVRIDAFL